MPTNRTVSVTSVFAQNASTNIPASPVAGSSYRNANMTTTEVEAGWPFKTIVDSSNFNQTMFELSSIAKQFEQYGFLPWSNLTNYPIGGFALGSNGTLYQALQATGPATTAMDPTTDTNMTYWQAVQFGSHTGMVSPYAGSVAPTGWLICDGSAISRTTYSALFAVIGTTYGTGDGSTTFNLPNFVNKTFWGGTTSGTVKAAGLPNITGSLNTTGSVGDAQRSATGGGSGALASKETKSCFNSGVSGVSSQKTGVSFNASNSNSIYGKSSTVQPPALQTLVIVKY